MQNFVRNRVSLPISGIRFAVTQPENPRRPAGLDDATVEAVGTVAVGLEVGDRARGHLYSFRQLMGHADLLLGKACDQLREAGHGAVADRLEDEVVGRNVLYGRWTFQIV